MPHSGTPGNAQLFEKNDVTLALKCIVVCPKILRVGDLGENERDLRGGGVAHSHIRPMFC